MAKLTHVEGEEFFRVFDLVRAGKIGSVVSESLSAASFSPCVDDAVIRVYEATGNVIETHEHAGDFKEP
jgi:hypothetical protein